MKHTKGPWMASDLGNGMIVHPVDFKDSVICKIKPSSYLRGQALEDEWVICIRNAHLIAAAPEMLEALEKLVKAVENNEFQRLACSKAKEIIKKAKG